MPASHNLTSPLPPEFYNELWEKHLKCEFQDCSADETLTTQVVHDAQDVRWQVEERHRGLNQLTGTEACQCRSARAQRNHLACCYHAWVSLKAKALQLGTTVYQVRALLFREYLRAELRQPHIPAV